MADKLEYRRKNPFVMLSHDFIKCDFINWNEKDVYIILLMYADSEQRCFPSVNTLCKISGKSNKTIIKALKGLEEKKLLKKEKRITKNGQTSNLYILYNFEDIWKAESVEQIADIVSIETKRQQLYELAKELDYIIVKEKELDSEPTKAQNQTQIPNTSNHPDNTIDFQKSQDLERYTLNQIKEFFGYEAMIHDYPDEQGHIDSVMDILHTTMNTAKKTIRISGTDKPTMVVIGKLMKLNSESVLYAIRKFREQTERIKNPTAYMLAILYAAPEQYKLDITNQVQHDLF